MEDYYGPTTRVGQEIHATKYRAPGEDFHTAMCRIAGALCDSEEHRQDIKDLLLHQRFLPAGRVQSAVGSPNQVTAFNCFVSSTIEDSMRGIMGAFTDSAETQRFGGGIGYDFSTIRPRGDIISKLSSPSSGPISFMHIGDSVCGTVSSAGNRRGAQMAVLRVDHPDIEEFITAKNNDEQLTRYNMSVGITDKFMDCLESGKPFPLKFKGRVYREVNAKNLWEMIMRSTWDWAEPGILFLDTINKWNNLWYCEVIRATNPCGEQPLPPSGACLLGSFNLVQYIHNKSFDFDTYKDDIGIAVRMMDNVIDETVYPLKSQEIEAKSKRRMGLGVTGIANALECLGFSYGSDGYIAAQEELLTTLRDEAYKNSVELAREKGAFPDYVRGNYEEGKFIRTLPKEIRGSIKEYGIRNSHLLSIAPTGTISLSADNVSGGIEPPFALSYERTIQTEGGAVTEVVEDYAYREWGIKGVTSDELSTAQHIAVQASAQRFVDSAVSKTVNVGADVTWDEFKSIYVEAWKSGCKGCTTFRAAGKRFGILKKTEETGEACYIDKDTGEKACG